MKRVFSALLALVFLSAFACAEDITWQNGGDSFAAFEEADGTFTFTPADGAAQGRVIGTFTAETGGTLTFTLSAEAAGDNAQAVYIVTDSVSREETGSALDADGPKEYSFDLTAGTWHLGAAARGARMTLSDVRFEPNAEASVFTVTVLGPDGEPLEGAMVNFCTDSACMPAYTGADGTASADACDGGYTVHLLKVPEGYACDSSAEYTVSPGAPSLTISAGR